MVRQIGLEVTQNITQSREGFRYQGSNYNIDIANVSDNLVKVANQKYEFGERTNVNQTLEPGESKEFARIEVDEDHFILIFTTSATAHPTVEYNYYIDDPDNIDENLSGSAPWASPPQEYQVRRRGYMIADDFVSLEISEDSGNTEYSSVEGWLNAIILEKK